MYLKIYLVKDNGLPIKGFEMKEPAEYFARMIKLRDEQAYRDDMKHVPAKVEVQPIIVEMA